MLVGYIPPMAQKGTTYAGIKSYGIVHITCGIIIPSKNIQTPPEQSWRRFCVVINLTHVVKQRKKRIKFNVIRESKMIEEIMHDLPDDNTVYKMVSFGGFSSLGFVNFVANRSKITSMTASTLRVGKNHLKVLDVLHKKGNIEHVHFIVGSIMSNDSATGKKYGYFDSLQDVCDANGWDITVYSNHIKVILFATDKGKYVLETSSNLNENPKMEQFSFEKSDELYAMYKNVFEEVQNMG